MKKDNHFNVNVRYNENYNLYQANCIGFFNVNFLNLIQIIKKQEEIYSLYSQNTSNSNELSVMYEALENMRVAIIQK